MCNILMLMQICIIFPRRSDLALNFENVERIIPPSDSVGIITIAGSWHPALWAAVAGVTRAWCAANNVPFICPPEEIRCRILDRFAD